jgi:hypothetical protein
MNDAMLGWTGGGEFINDPFFSPLQLFNCFKSPKTLAKCVMPAFGLT